MVDDCRAMPAYRGQPILFNEDDHFHFDRPMNNMGAAISEYAGWGFFDYRMKGEVDFNEGYQSVPVNWGLSSERKLVSLLGIAPQTVEAIIHRAAHSAEARRAHSRENAGGEDA